MKILYFKNLYFNFPNIILFPCVSKIFITSILIKIDVSNKFSKI